MKNKFLNSFIIITLVLVAFIVYNKFKLSGNSHFTVTADTVIKPGSEISKYVTQEEVDSFSFRYADIHCDKETNSTLVPLRQALMIKDTNKVVNFIKDNNLSVNLKMLDGRTPIMYSSFYNDINTTKELINLGADVHLKDRYKLNALAYAISTNSAQVVKFLFDNGMKMDEIKEIQYYYPQKKFYRTISQIVIDSNYLDVKYKDYILEENCDNSGISRSAFEVMDYLTTFNLYNTARVILESGYKPYTYRGKGESVIASNSIQDIFTKEDVETGEINPYDYTVYKNLEYIPNFEPMLDLLLEHNVSGQPSKEFLKSEYEKCYKDKKSDELFYEYYEINKKKFDEDDIKVGKTPEKENQFFPLQKYMWLKHYYTYCKDENSTFNNTKEYINWKNANNLLKTVSPKLENNNPKIIFKNTSQDEVMNCYRKLVEPSSSKINLNDNCLNLKF